MTKKDLEVIAQVFRVSLETFRADLQGRKESEREYLLFKLEIMTTEILVGALSANLLKNYPHFDSKKFERACGVTPYELPCLKCGGKRDVEARICSKCHV